MPALLISIRFYDGRYHGAGDWPPAPARLFQALVAAAAQPSLDSAKAALQWLEALDAPIIAAPAKHEGKPISLFVPNNDIDSVEGIADKIITKGQKKGPAVSFIRTGKPVHPRLFDATVPLLYIWRFDGDERQAQCICNIADGLYQLGRGVDMAWAVGELIDEVRTEKLLSDYPGAIYRPSQAGKGLALDCPDDGSLTSLENRYKANSHRFTHVNGKIQFANAPKPRFRAVAYNSPATRLLFELRYTTAPGAPFASWPLESTATLVQKLRDGAVAKLARLKLGSPLDEGTINKVLIGRDATEADKALRIRIIPIPSIGHVHVHPGIRRVLVEVPPNCPICSDDMAWGFAGLEVIAPVHDDETGEILSSPVELVKADDDSMLAHYGVAEEYAARLWRSVTPLALPEDAKRRHINPAESHEEVKGGKELTDEQQRVCYAVLQALRHAGWREKVVGIRVQRDPFSTRGERAEAFASGTRFSKRQLWYVEIEFAEAISGPLILGNGRYSGLGLMAPVQQVEGVLAFSIMDGLAADAEPLQLARALRRVVMARVRDTMGLRDTDALPMFFCGHEIDGSAARRGRHTHLAFVPDLARQRLLVIAPHLMEHRKPSKDECEHLTILVRALAGLSELRAGRAGKLALEQVDITPEVDPLFAASKEWAAATPYAPTRHAKRNGRDSLRDDVLQEVERRQLPVPLAVERKDTNLLLRFKVAVPGPVLLGKTIHFGGGLFACSL
jgi:CRISPR-associated protein Csb2